MKWGDEQSSVLSFDVVLTRRQCIQVSDPLSFKMPSTLVGYDLHAMFCQPFFFLSFNDLYRKTLNGRVFYDNLPYMIMRRWMWLKYVTRAEAIGLCGTWEVILTWVNLAIAKGLFSAALMSPTPATRNLLFAAVPAPPTAPAAQWTATVGPPAPRLHHALSAHPKPPRTGAGSPLIQEQPQIATREKRYFLYCTLIFILIYLFTGRPTLQQICICE